MTADKFRTLSQFKCLRAIAEPGEPVGLLAAQVRGRREGEAEYRGESGKGIIIISSLIYYSLLVNHPLK